MWSGHILERNITPLTLLFEEFLHFNAHGRIFEIYYLLWFVARPCFLLSIHKVPPFGSSFTVLFNWVSSPVSQSPSFPHSLTLAHTHQDPQVPLLVVWCTPGGGGLHVLTLLEHYYCTLEGQLEVLIVNKEEEQTTSVYQSSHSTLTTLQGHRLDERSCMGLSIRLEVFTIATLAHLILLLNITFHVQCVTLQHEKLSWWFLHDLPAHHPGPESTMDISWQTGLVIVAPCLSVWTTLHRQYQTVQQWHMKPYSTTLKWSVLGFPVHHMTHRRKSRV